MGSNYDAKFYKQIVDGSQNSANVIVPMVLEHLSPKSVLEIGCGMATWSASFLRHGVVDLMAVDGPWVDPKSLQIPTELFRSHDLREPFKAGRKFDLVVCMEVAEHLPPSMAESIVETLAVHADTVLFAAAIPFQGGTDHINERPQSYWAELFSKHGLGHYDFIRPNIWHNKDVEVWYRQNTIVYSARDLNISTAAILDVVHPDLVDYYLSDWRGVARSVRRLLGSASRKD